MSTEKFAQFALERFGLVGKKALVTGGSKGLGEGVVEELCQLGAQVIICSRSKDVIDKKLQDWRKRGFKVEGFPIDVSKEQSVKELMEKTSKEYGGSIDILVNNVGANGDYHEPQDFKIEDYEWMMDVNLKSLFLVTKYAFPLLQKGKDPCVVNMSSISGGPQAMENNTLYCMCKAALNQFNRQIACDWAKYGIRVNAVSPWYIMSGVGLQYLGDEAYRQKIMKATPLRRLGEVSDCSGVMAFLCSKSASWITGENIFIDGGLMAKGFGNDEY